MYIGRWINMLILSRKIDQKIIIGENIEITIIDVKGDQVKIGIEAPKNLKVFRQEVYQEILKENEAARITGQPILPKLHV